MPGTADELLGQRRHRAQRPGGLGPDPISRARRVGDRAGPRLVLQRGADRGEPGGADVGGRALQRVRLVADAARVRPAVPAGGSAARPRRASSPRTSAAAAAPARARPVVAIREVGEAARDPARGPRSAAARRPSDMCAGRSRSFAVRRPSPPAFRRRARRSAVAAYPEALKAATGSRGRPRASRRSASGPRTSVSYASISTAFAPSTSPRAARRRARPGRSAAPWPGPARR